MTTNPSTRTTPSGNLAVQVWGDLACFTRPETKVERVSYPVMTPSAARGVLEAILWKPEFSWQVRAIRVLEPIRRISLLRNEVNSKASERAAKGWMKAGTGGYLVEDDRTQRHTLALRDVRYVIEADQVVHPDARADNSPAKYRDMFERRVKKGQCFSRPYLGCREFAAFFAPADHAREPIDETSDLGRMLFDLVYTTDNGATRGEPRFFEARLERGVLRVPSELYAAERG